jgi:hypothetical protein
MGVGLILACPADRGSCGIDTISPIEARTNKTSIVCFSTNSSNNGFLNHQPRICHIRFVVKLHRLQLASCITANVEGIAVTVWSRT